MSDNPWLLCQEVGHHWEEVYYGWQCSECGEFHAFGCEPWMPIDDDSDDLDDLDILDGEDDIW